MEAYYYACEKYGVGESKHSRFKAISNRIVGEMPDMESMFDEQAQPEDEGEEEEEHTQEPEIQQVVTPLVEAKAAKTAKPVKAGSVKLFEGLYNKARKMLLLLQTHVKQQDDIKGDK